VIEPALGLLAAELQSPVHFSMGKRPRDGERVPAAKRVVGEKKGLAGLQERLKSKLAGSQFRWINEQLYTQTGKASWDMYQRDPKLFEAYHQGYRDQVERWPINPLDLIIRSVSKLPPSAVVADMGCGEARLAASVPQTVHSFDLVAANSRVTACNIAHTPLPDASVDCVVFCLALMGTDYEQFLREAARVCKPGGKLLIAEVRSRVEGAGEVGEEQTKLSEDDARRGVDMFCEAVASCGFRVGAVDRRNTMFLLLQCTREDSAAAAAPDEAVEAPPVTSIAASSVPSASSSLSKSAKRRLRRKHESPKVALKACVYKRR
jgi:ribosomal RNA-processing protein 8